MKIHALQNNFNGGIFSPKMLGRVDYARYASAVKDTLNCIPMIQGGMKRRDGTQYINTRAISGSDADMRLIPFISSTTNAYLLEFYGAALYIYKDDVLVATLVSPYTGTNVKTKIRYSHSGDSMIFTHPDFPEHRLTRVSDTVWRLTQFVYDIPPLEEVGVNPAANITLSGVSGIITITAGSSVFIASDVGRQIAAGAGLGSITAQGGTTATVTVFVDFDATSYTSGNWTILDSAVSNVTPSDINVGQGITLTGSIATWRTTDVAHFIRINDGIVKITGYSSPTVANAVVITKLSSANVAYPGSWQNFDSAFSASRGYPTACAIFEGRLILGGTRTQPNKYWASEVNNIKNFAPGINANDPFDRFVTSDRQDAIQHMVSSRTLVIFTYGGEFSVFASDDGPLTPLTVASRLQSTYGCNSCAPEQIGLSVIYAQRGGKKVRAADFDGQRGGYISPDISEIADHLIDDVKEIHFQANPLPMLWVVNANSLVSCTFSAEQSVLAWSRHTLPGSVVSMATLPGTSDDIVYLSVIVNKPAGGTEFWLLKFNKDCYHDAGYLQTTIVKTDPVPDLPWLADRNYSITSDEDYLGVFLAGPAGDIEPTVPINGFERNIGIEFDSYIDLLPPEFQIPSTIQGRMVGISEVVVRVLETRSLLVNDEPLLNRLTVGPVFDLPMASSTGDYKINKIGVGRNTPPMRLRQGIPAPFTILACVRTISVGD